MDEHKVQLTTPSFNQIQQLPPLQPFDHDLFQTELLPPTKLIPILNPPSHLEQCQQQPGHHHREEEELYLTIADQLSSKESHRAGENHDRTNLIYSWDSFDRPICSQSSLTYQTPYPAEESVLVWEAILASSQLTLSSPIGRKRFITNFFRHSIGLKTNTPSSFQSNPVSLPISCPRVFGLTDHSTRSIYHISDTACKNLSTIESFIKLNHHPYHPFQCLSSSLAILIDWIRTEIMDCFESEFVLDSGLLSTSLILDPILRLLGALANLVKTCEQHKNLMPEDAVYENLNYHIQRRSSSLIQAVFSWLLDRVCVAFLLSWQSWLGIDLGTQPTVWGEEKDRLGQSLWNHYGIQSDSSSDIQELSLDHLDQLGSTPSSYSLKRNRVPRFLPITMAETVFKAGLSLRILRRANPYHPICLTFPVQEEGQSRWVWTPCELEKVQKSFKRQRNDMKTQISAWRHDLKLSTDPSAPLLTSITKSKSSAADIEQPLDIDVFLRHITTGLESHGNQHSNSRSHYRCHQGLIETLEQRLKYCSTDGSGLLHSMELPSLDVLTGLTVLESLRCRAQDIDRCLLSFFLIDLDLVNHLNILDQFMFCHDVMFNQRLSNALFGSNNGPLDARRPVGVSARLLRRGTWPPGGFDLAFALRTVILDSVAFDQRPVSYCSSRAWDELEDRLSFAIRPGIEIDAMQTMYKAESINGFEFLMIDFKPPEALGTVLGPKILEQYQTVNNHLMKLLRLQSMMRSNWSLIRPRRQNDKCKTPYNTSGRLERYFNAVDVLATNSQRLLDGLISYTWEIAIGKNWRSFITKIELSQQAVKVRETWVPKPNESAVHGKKSGVEIPQTTTQNATADTAGDRQQYIESIEELIKFHTLMLKEIMNCLFLRPKQQVYLNLLSRSIFETIIELSIHLEENYTVDEKEGNSLDDERAEEELIQKIDMIKIKQFEGVHKLIKYIDQLHQRSGDHQTSDPKKIGFLKEFMVSLDFNSFYFHHQ